MDNNYRHIVLTFDQAQQPKFEEKKGKGWVEYGKDNDYPKYLLSLYNESAKHGAIVKSKSNYIYGKGFEVPGSANSKGETWNNIVKRCIKDDELYRGYFLQVIWNRAKKISEVYHIEFAKVRVSKDLTTFFVKNDWSDFKEKPRVYSAFDMNNPVGSQIYYYKEYNPSSECYPMPSYFQGLNYIECDIKVSRHLLGMANQSFTGTTLVNLNNGDPISEEHKGEVERSLLKKFTGDEGKRVVIMFNKSRDNAAEILPLGTSTLTKEDFTNVNNLIQQEIFASHQIVSPSLMGIKTEGQLGGRNEIREAYEIFMNTYVSERQDEISGIITKFRNLKGESGEFKLIPLEPLKFEFSESIMAANLTQDEIRELMGKEPLQQGQITSDGKSAQPIMQNQPVQQEANDAIKNLTGRQYQNVMRIVRQFANGKLTKGQASLMLKNGFNFTDSDVNTFLGIDDSPLTDFEIQHFSSDEEDRIINEFNLCGDDSDHFTINERVALRFADITEDEAKVVKLLTDNKNLTSEAISNEIGLSVDDTNTILKKLIDKEIISTKIIKVGTDSIIETKVLKPLSELGYKSGTQVFIRYTYEWRDIVPESERDTTDHPSRKFCKAMTAMSANKEGKNGKMWSMTDIQNISMRLGYDVLARVGGWWTDPRNLIPYQCRHEWFANTVIKK
jgi:DNA-binding Lrp family transcriptional regulator